MNPFAELELEPALDLDAEELEQSHLRLSRGCHPDRHRRAGAEQQVAVLERSARLNDAYRVLRDRWRRAKALLELRDPGVLERTKRLDPAFLAGAIELAEAVAEAGSGAGTLRADLERKIDGDFAAVRAAVDARDWATAATVLHQSRYHRKALHDLPA